MIADPGPGTDPQGQRERERESHLDDVVREIKTGRLTVFLGAGANALARPKDQSWVPEAEYLPLGGELARHLATEFKYPFAGGEDLARVSQWVAMEKSIGTLYDHLNGLFQRGYPLNSLHRFLAALPRLLKSKGYPRIRDLRRFLLVTTNYDDLLERAFAEAGEPVHVVTYKWEKESGQEALKGCFFHRSAGSNEVRRIEASPNDYKGFEDGLPVILKVHGALDIEGQHSLIITEDHYLDYIYSTPSSLASFFPNPLPQLLINSAFLFLGYALKDWNLRLILRRISRERPLGRNSWSIQIGPDPHDALFWRKNDVKVLEWPLPDYIEALRERVEAMPSLSGGTPS